MKIYTNKKTILTKRWRTVEACNYCGQESKFDPCFQCTPFLRDIENRRKEITDILTMSGNPNTKTGITGYAEYTFTQP